MLMMPVLALGVRGSVGGAERAGACFSAGHTQAVQEGWGCMVRVKKARWVCIRR